MKLDGLSRQLAAAGVSINTLRDQIRAQVAWRRYMGGRFGSSIRITDDQVRATRARLNAAAAKPQFLVSEIYLDAQRVGGIDVARNGAQQLLEQLKQGAPFAAVARQFSASASATNGGDDGWLVSGEMQPPVQAALQGLSPGELSAPVETPDGVYIFLLRDRRAGASSLMVNMKQAWTADTSPAAEANLAALKAKVRGCDGFEEQAKKMTGLSYGETGEVDIVQLSPDIKTGLAEVKPGETTQILRTPHGAHVVALCSRRQGDAREPSKNDIENRLYGEELSMLSKRFLRDLHNSATIEAR
jgi:peptidyl-prolyl cis-trans isomerase SurA